MITKNDCLILLTELAEKGIDTSKYFKETLRNENINMEVLEFINSNMQLDLSRFYEKLRKSYNKKSSKLYINIVNPNFKDQKDILTTLASLNLQILLFSKNVKDLNMFLSHARFEEINKCLLNYYKTNDLIPCQKLLNLVKADLKVLEELNK